jgi:fructoselysine-6-P-deglycase FrlB-like protein
MKAPRIPERIRVRGAAVLALAALVLAQRYAVAAADARGLDPDRPRSLTRSVILPAQEVET